MESSLSGEIDMLRVLMRRVFNRMIDEADDLKAWMGALSAISAASQRVAGLLRMEQTLGEKRADAAGALSQALREVLDEMEANERARVPGCSGYRMSHRRQIARSGGMRTGLLHSPRTCAWPCAGCAPPCAPVRTARPGWTARCGSI